MRLKPGILQWAAVACFCVGLIYALGLEGGAQIGHGEQLLRGDAAAQIGGLLPQPGEQGDDAGRGYRDDGIAQRGGQNRHRGAEFVFGQLAERDNKHWKQRIL